MISASALATASLLTVLLASPREANCEPSRRISAGSTITYTIFDSDYFGLDSAIGAEVILRYELAGNIYFESRLGGFSTSKDGQSIGGLNGQFGISGFLTNILPFRPHVRAAFGLQSVNPVTTTPTDTFRPSQTTLYFIAGVGIGRYVWRELIVELSADLMATPYKYMKYSFDRQSVTSEEAQFTHYVIALGASYTF